MDQIFAQKWDHTEKIKIIPKYTALHFEYSYCVCLITIKRAPTRTIEQWNLVGAKIMIMWEEQLVDPPNEFIDEWLCMSKWYTV